MKTVIYTFILLAVLTNYLLSYAGFWGWGYEPGGNIRVLLLLVLYSCLVVVAVSGFMIGILRYHVLATLAVAALLAHVSLYGTWALSSVHGMGKFQNPALYALAAVIVILRFLLPVNRPSLTRDVEKTPSSKGHVRALAESDNDITP